jgi:hypothetical protein
MTLFLVTGIPLAVALWMLWIAITNPRPGHGKPLRGRRLSAAFQKEYIALSSVPAPQALLALDSALRKIRRRYPDRSEGWYSKQLLSELRSRSA